MDIQELTKYQKEIAEQIQTLILNLKEDSNIRITREYLKTRNTNLEKFWVAFQERHKLIQKEQDGNSNHPYFKENFYNKVKESHTEAKKLLDNKLEEKSQKNTPSTSNTQTTESIDEQVKRFKKQEAKMNSLLRIIDNIDNAGDETKSKAYYQQKLRTLSDYWIQVTKIHDEIMSYSTKEDEEHEYIKLNRYADLEDVYEKTIINVQTEYDTFSNIQHLGKTENLHEMSSSLLQPQAPKIKLPPLNIPHFSGNYNNWISFHDLFSQLIHNNDSLGKAQKMYYLKANIIGEAAKLLQHLQTTDENYDAAWEMLNSRYNNKRILVATQLQILFNQKVLTFESANGLKSLHDTTKECLHAIKNLQISTSEWGPIIIHILTQKLDKETHRLYEQSLKQPRDIQGLEEFFTFLEARFQALEAVGERQRREIHNCRTQVQPHRYESKVQQSPLYKNYHSTIKAQCYLCNGEHALQGCTKYLSMNPKQRLDFIKEKGICTNCLSVNHKTMQCKSLKTCRACQKKHHTTLHAQDEIKKATTYFHHMKSTQENCDNKDTKINVHSHLAENDPKYYKVLLATALIQVTSDNGSNETLRALIDQGSQATFITECAAQKLKLKRSKIHATVAGIGSSKADVSKYSVELKIKARYSSAFECSTTALVVKKITKFLPGESIENRDYKHIRHLVLADPTYEKSGPIDILLGADIFGEIILNGVIKGPRGAPIAQETELGWILSGKLTDKSKNEGGVVCLIAQTDTENELRQFWEIEELHPVRQHTAEEIQCERFYENTVKRASNGRYIVRIPFKPETAKQTPLGNSRGQAIARLIQMEKKFAKTQSLELEYKKFMSEYLKLHHMIEAKPINRENNKNVCYLPHHAVMKEDSTTTKLRVVFDASAKTSSGVTLNDKMMVGPVLQPELISTLLRWRKHKFAYTADIEKMYRQIQVAEEDQDLQRIIWRNDPTQPFKEYKLTTVTYGTSSAPYLAIKTLQKLAHDDKAKYPVGAKITLEDFYVDDLLSGNDSLLEAKEAQEQIINLLKGGGFKLRKWACNDRKILKNISKELQEEGSLQIPNGDMVKTLGIFWNPKKDQFEFKIHLPKRTDAPTKRTIVSETAKLFDPLGWLAPTIILAKIMHQELWLAGVSWDESIPSSISMKWNKLRKDLILLEKIKIPRWINYTKQAKQVELHGFCDASEQAYAAVIYSRVITENGNIIVTLLTAKTRVAPISKKLTLPQLELSGALLLAKLMKQVKDAMDINNLNIWAWTDSTIVLAWLHGQPHKWKTFVANRVSEIHSLINTDKWHHVKSTENPADCASRGKHPDQLQEYTLWWKGPKWLSEAVIMKDKKISATTNLERKEVVSYYTSIRDSEFYQELLTKYSSVTRLTRVLTFCKRFIDNAKKSKNQRNVRPLTKNELHETTNKIIIHTQKGAFAHDIRQLTTRRSLNKNSKLLSLNPFIDGDKILRVGGRLQQSTLSYEEKHPIILPHKSALTTMIINKVHRATLHGGNTLTLSQVRSKYWIIRGLSAVRQHIHKCITCHRYNADSSQQLMGSLPKPRIDVSRPFTHTGVDYAGPIDIKMSPGRGNKSYKGYIAIFICLATKAIHIELVSNLTAQGFIAAFKRLVGRRGSIAHIYSDNASNFVLASKILKLNNKQYIDEYQNIICNYVEQSGTEWHFIPPVSPNFGGLWEAGVKSIKYHLKRTIGEIKLTYEELSTILIQIEACLNSRPLSPITEDINSLDVITPGHFLIGAPLLAPPERNYLIDKVNTLTRWQLLSRVTQDFWKKWSSEYLSRLQQRPKWTHQQSNIEIGNLVLLKDEQLPPARWALARILEIHPGKDGLTRVVTLKTANSTFKRPISKLSLLPISDNNKPLSTNNTVTAYHCTINESTQKVINKQCVSKTNLNDSTEKIFQSKSASLIPENNNHLKKLTERFKAVKSSGTRVRINPTYIPVRPSIEELITYSTNQRRKNENKRTHHQESTEADDSKRLRVDPSTARNNRTKILKPSALLSILMVTIFVMPTIAQTITEPYEVTPFVNRPGIYFEELGEISVYNNEWNIIVYYDLANYWNELMGFRQLVNKASNMCKLGTVWHNNCHSITEELKRHLQVMEQNNDLLHQRNNNDENILSRVKKAPLEIIGSVAHAMFGVLDEEFAKHHEAQIQNIKHNENHLLNLIKNQTSITESTINIFKKTHIEIERQFEVVDRHLESISKTVRNNHKDFNAQQDFLSLALYINIIISQYQQTQNALITAVLDIQHGKINHLILTPKQLRKQLTMIKANLPSNLKIPADNKKGELLKIYSLLSTTARVTSQNVIIDIRIPLVINEYMQLFKIIPVPTEYNNELVFIKPSTEYLAVSLHRERYFPITSQELIKCHNLGETLICRQHQPIYNQYSNLNRCEMDLLNHEKMLSPICHIQAMERIPVWIQLHNRNSWIYILDQDYTFNIVCGTTVIEKTLRDDGILKLQPNCEIKQKSMIISSHNVITTHLHNAFIPTTNLTDQLWIDQKLNESQLIIEPHRRSRNNEIESLNITLQRMKTQQKLPETISRHDIHHYSIIYSSLILFLIIIAGYILWNMKQSRQGKTKHSKDPSKPARKTFYTSSFQLQSDTPPEDFQTPPEDVQDEHKK